MLQGVKVNLVETIDEAMALKRWLSERRRILGVDTETSGLDFWRDDLRMVQVGDATTGWAIPWPTWGGVAKEVIESYEGPIAMHNAKFDIHFLEDAGVRIRRDRVHDTRIMAHLVNNMQSTALKNLTTRFVDKNANRLQGLLSDAMSSNKWTWGSVPHDYPVYWQYAALDPVLTCRLVELFEEEASSKFWESYDIELACHIALVDVERRGMLVDDDYCVQMAMGINTQCTRLEEEAKIEFGVENVGSRLQVIKKLQDDGVVLTKTTDKGSLSLDDDVLKSLTRDETLGGGHRLAEIVLVHRHMSKIKSTYLQKFHDLADDEGFLHPSINSLAAKTGRMSVSRPSLQNLERTSDVRDAFIARPGHKLLLVDYDQIEMRIMAHVAQDESLMETFRPGQEVDPYTLMARQLLHDETLQRDDPRRQTTKNAAYAKIYGAGIAQFARTAGITFAEAESFMADFDRRYPKVSSFIDGLINAAGVRVEEDGYGWVRTPYGRELRAPRRDKLYVLVNYFVQGTAAQVLKEKIVALQNAGLLEHFVLPVHDEFVFDVPEADVDDYLHAVKETVEEHTRFDVPLTVGELVTDRWGSKYPEGLVRTELRKIGYNSDN